MFPRSLEGRFCKNLLEYPTQFWDDPPIASHQREANRIMTTKVSYRFPIIETSATAGGAVLLVGLLSVTFAGNGNHPEINP